MSASNWTICPECLKRSIALRESFVKKYYGKLDSFVYNKVLEEINNAVEHIESYSSHEYEPNKEILSLMEERQIEVDYLDNTYTADEILQKGKTSSTLREDYEQGVDTNGNVYLGYSCECNCGFNKNIKYEEDKHKIVDLR